MDFRNVLVLMDDTQASINRVRTAAAFAARRSASLTGMTLRSEFLQPLFAADAMAFMPPAEIDRVIKEHRRAVDETTERARLAFEEVAREFGVVSDWRVVSGADNQAIVAAARRSDLCVLPPRLSSPSVDYAVSAEAIGLASGGPISWLPEGPPSPVIGKRVLVAWNGSREAARALRDAGPILGDAEAVTVLVVAPKGAGGPDHDLQQHLERHGIEAAVLENRGEDHAASDLLRDEAQRAAADLVVMGLYGHARVREAVLGGVSRAMLKDPPVPVFMSH